MQIFVNSRVLNAPHLTVSNRADSVKFEIAVIADQDYEQFGAKTTCNEKRKASTKLIPVVVPVDGDWSSNLNSTETMTRSKVFTLQRPKIYYFEILDCQGDIQRVFKTG